MKNISNQKQEILNYLTKNPSSKVISMINFLGISKQAVQKHLKELIELGLIKKVGSAPKVFYSLL